MDKRIIKTKEAIHKGFYDILEKKDYDAVTIQDILNESGVSRSAFYANFKSKNEVLLSITSDIFDHVFSHKLDEEKTHDFSKSNILDYWQYIEHYLYHLSEEKELVKAILKNSCRSVFLKETKEKIDPLSKIIIGEQGEKYEGIPMALSTDSLTETIILSSEYWLSNDCKENPETIVTYIKTISGCK